MSTNHYKYVILGGGLTAGYAAQEFVAQGIQADELCILSAEKTLPYERPPLSKKFLANEKTTADILINDPSFYEENGIEVKLDTAVTRVRLDEKQLDTDTETIKYERLLIATGCRPRTFDLPGADLDNIFYLRQITDARQIRQMAEKVDKAVVIGGSFIGMETASVLQASGVAVTLLFPEARVWESFFTPEMSTFFETYYRDKGITILPGQEVASFKGNGRVTHVVTKTGKQLAADMVLAGIGVTPNSALFSEQLHMEKDTILVNRFLETNLPDVWAAGDITSYRDLLYDRVLHVEHWDNAVQQGQHAARAMLGQRQPYEHVPYFFSDVFDLSYEFWGDSNGAKEAVHRGDVADGRFSTWWLAADGRLLAAFVMNRPDEEREVAPKWIKSGKKLSSHWLKDSESFTPKEEKEEEKKERTDVK